MIRLCFPRRASRRRRQLGDLGRILIVEDDPLLLEQLTWALKGKFSVDAARSNADGRAVPIASDPDLFLFDLRLPFGDSGRDWDTSPRSPSPP